MPTIRRSLPTSSTVWSAPSASSASPCRPCASPASSFGESPASRPHEPAQADQPLDRRHHDQDEGDLDRGGGGDHELTALELEIAEDLDRQRRAARAGQEQRGVELAEGDDEGEEPARQHRRPDQRQYHEEKGPERTGAQALSSLLESG